MSCNCNQIAGTIEFADGMKNAYRLVIWWKPISGEIIVRLSGAGGAYALSNLQPKTFVPKMAPSKVEAFNLVRKWSEDCLHKVTNAEVPPPLEVQT